MSKVDEMAWEAALRGVVIVNFSQKEAQKLSDGHIKIL